MVSEQWDQLKFTKVWWFIMSETLVEKQPSVIWWINLENSSFLNFKNNEEKKANRKVFLQYKCSYQNRRIILEGREGMAIYSKKTCFLCSEDLHWMLVIKWSDIPRTYLVDTRWTTDHYSMDGRTIVQYDLT